MDDANIIFKLIEDRFPVAKHADAFAGGIRQSIPIGSRAAIQTAANMASNPRHRVGLASGGVGAKGSKVSSSKRSWTLAEDMKLKSLVEKHGPKRWSFIAEHMSGRVGKQCRERWHNHLNPHVRKGSWTPEEDMVIFEQHKRVGNQWALISKLMPGRTDNAIKNRYYSTVRRLLRREKKRMRERARNGEPLTAAEVDMGNQKKFKYVAVGPRTLQIMQVDPTSGSDPRAASGSASGSGQPMTRATSVSQTSHSANAPTQPFTSRHQFPVAGGTSAETEQPELSIVTATGPRPSEPGPSEPGPSEPGPTEPGPTEPSSQQVPQESDQLAGSSTASDA